MLTDVVLTDSRKRAENAVADMPEGELKTAAFSVILSRLLSEDSSPQSGGRIATASGPVARSSRAIAAPKRRVDGESNSLSFRLLTLRADGFFAGQRSLADVREELRKHGWHYPLTTLSGPMQTLVRSRELRREQVLAGKGKKKVWKYSNR